MSSWIPLHDFAVRRDRMNLDIIPVGYDPHGKKSPPPPRIHVICSPDGYEQIKHLPQGHDASKPDYRGWRSVYLHLTHGNLLALRLLDALSTKEMQKISKYL